GRLGPLALGRELTPTPFEGWVLAGLPRLPLPRRGPAPVDALDRVGRNREVGAGQAAEQQLYAPLQPRRHLPAEESGQAAPDLPRRAAHDRERPEVLAGEPPDAVDDLLELGRAGRLDSALALRDDQPIPGQ